MFKRAMTLLCMTSVLSAGLLDFQTLEKARSSYEAGDYEESAKNYGAIEEKSDALHYNLGNAYYKEKQYDKAISEFKQVNAPELKAKSLHNLGNAYAQNKKIDEAITAYEEALKLGDDQDTKFNLELLKKQKQQQKKQQKQDKNKEQQNKEQDQKQQDQKDQQQKSQDQKDQQQKDKEQKNRDQKGQDQKQQDQKDQQQKDQEKKDQQKSEAEKKAEEEKKKAAQEKKRKEEAKRKEEEKAQEGKPQEVPISDMQERKYEKMLDKRGIKTLMVPLKTKGGRDEETTAW